MTKRRSKEPVTVPGKELAIIASPCPVWDAEIKATLNGIHALALDRTVFPDDREFSRKHFARELCSRVEKLDNGQWIEAGQVVELPEPWPRLDAGPASVWDLLNKAADGWTPEERLAWINSVTDTTIR